MINIEKLEALGNKWEKDDKKRIYFDNLELLYGLETSHYNTGNISSATLDGEKISNSKALKISQGLHGKLFYDLNTEKFGCVGLNREYASELIQKIKDICQ